MIVELISVGTELLLGNIVNTNAQYLSETCAKLGLNVYYQTTVGDNRERMTEVFRTALSRADLVIIGGGLGPTEDDITKDVCAELMGMPLVEDPEVRAHLEDWYRQRRRTDIPDSNWRQALVPEGAVVFSNTNGTAPGLALEKNGKTAILLPGPPNELYPMVEDQVCASRPHRPADEPDDCDLCKDERSTSARDRESRERRRGKTAVKTGYQRDQETVR